MTTVLLLLDQMPWVIGPLLAFIGIALPVEVVAAIRMLRR